MKNHNFQEDGELLHFIEGDSFVLFAFKMFKRIVQVTSFERKRKEYMYT